MRKTLSERFWPKVEKVPGGCWLWKGATNGDGYGHIAVDAAGRKLMKAHRLAWELANGPIPDGKCVLHRCDTPNCVNPDHLFLGTQLENMRDCKAKGRLIPASRPRSIPAGENNPNARVTETQVREIRLKARAGVCQKLLQAEYGLSRAGIQRIVSRRAWPHVV